MPNVRSGIGLTGIAEEVEVRPGEPAEQSSALLSAFSAERRAR